MDSRFHFAPPKGFISTLCYFAAHIADHRFVNTTLPHMATNHLVEEVKLQKPQIHKATRKKGKQEASLSKAFHSLFQAKPSESGQQNHHNLNFIRQKSCGLLVNSVVPPVISMVVRSMAHAVLISEFSAIQLRMLHSQCFVSS